MQDPETDRVPEGLPRQTRLSEAVPCRVAEQEGADRKPGIRYSLKETAFCSLKLTRSRRRSAGAVQRAHQQSRVLSEG